jgi:hypothetical protein
MLIRVPTVRTNFSKTEFVKSLIKSWFNTYNVIPNKEQMGVLFSQWALETGSGTYCWNNNIGNVKAPQITEETIEYCVLNGVWEIVNGKKVILKPEDPGSWFRSFRTLDLGVEHHMMFLRNKRYRIAWTAVEQGDPALFAKLLKQQGYYTAHESDYVKAMQYHFTRFLNDSIFEMAMQIAETEFFAIEIPQEYRTVNIHNFPVKETVVERKLPATNQNVSMLNRALGKLKNIMKLS